MTLSREVDPQSRAAAAPVCDFAPLQRERGHEMMTARITGLNRKINRAIYAAEADASRWNTRSERESRELIICYSDCLYNFLIINTRVRNSPNQRCSVKGNLSLSLLITSKFRPPVILNNQIICGGKEERENSRGIIPISADNER